MIEITTKNSASAKEKGDLLEKLTEYLLRAQNYEVATEVRKTGVELDLLCRHKANSNKRLYVECKAYKDGKNIDANIIYNLIGKKTQKKYEEAWLVSTCAFGKEAKGVVDELYSDGRVDFSFYTPDKLIEALTDARIIVSHSVANHSLSKLVDKQSISIPILFVGPIGIYWVVKYRKGSKDIGVFVVDAESGDVVHDYDTLSEISEYESSLTGLNFQQIFSTESATEVGPFKFRLDEDYLRSIKDTGVMYTHPYKRVLDKDDLFIFPDLQSVNKDGKISSSRLSVLSGEFRKNFVFGDELSGKTTLAQKLQRVYIEAGFIPVYVNACNINSSSHEKFYQVICRCIKDQYACITESAINSINPKDVVLLIDDFHNIKLNKEAGRCCII